MKKLLLSLFCIATTFVTFSKENPIAKQDAMVVFGSARFTVLSAELIRMEYDVNQKFEDKASLVFINRDTDTPVFRVRKSGKTLMIDTDALAIKYIDNGRLFDATNLSISMREGNKMKPVWKPGVVDTLNLMGTFRTLDGIEGWDNYKNLEKGLLSRSGWTLIDDSKTNLFDGDPAWNWVVQRPEGAIDWYMLTYGDDYKKALKQFTQVAGKIPMPPKYTFGYWWSRYWIYNDSEVRDLVKQMKSYDIPIDVFIIDMDWHETWDITSMDYKRDMRGWTGYTWNKKLFPHPEKTLGWLEDQNLKASLNLHPAEGIAPMECQYGEFAKQIGFDTTTRKNIPFDISNKKWADTYFNVVLEPMQKQGVDFWWLDWQQWQEDRNIKNLNNTWWINYAFFTRMQNSGEQRPLLFHRWGGLGNHRYQIGFSGDAHSTWKSLDFQLFFTPTASNVCYGYWSHDIGGHQGDGDTDGELYLRWLQFGALSPMLRTHCSKFVNLERRIWTFPNYFEDMRDALKLRYSLAPYIYGASREAYDTGVSICRPMYYDYPKQENAYTYRTQYMFGDNILVAPISTPISKDTELAQREIWLPQGEWFEYMSGAMMTGNRVVDRYYAQHEIPLFVKAGTILPLYPDVKNLQQRPDREIIAIVPGGAKVSTTTLYEDDGTTDQYQEQKFARRIITRTLINDRTIEVVVEPTQGTYDGAPESQNMEIVILNSTLPSGVTINGKPLQATFDSKELSISIMLADLKKSDQVKLMIEFDRPMAELQTVFDGNKGFLKRLTKATAELKYTTARVDFAVGLPEGLYELSNIQNLLIYKPESAYSLMQQLNSLKPNVAEIIRNIPDASQQELNAKAEYMSK